MKKLVYLFFCVTTVLFSCKKQNDVPLHHITVQLAYPSESELTAVAEVKVKLSTNSTSFESLTDANGKATFEVPVGIYEASVTDSRTNGLNTFIYNGVLSNIAVSDSCDDSQVIQLSLTESKSSQLVIKELYVGGIQKDDGSGTFQNDGYIIIYNNSNSPADIGNVGIATIAPYNSQGRNDYYGTDGKLSYESEGWIPAAQAVWYFQQNYTIQPGQQMVIATGNAVNITPTHSKSINFDNPSYFATYDLTTFTNAGRYVSPAASIPTSQHLKAVKYGAGNGWALSVISPGLFIFNPTNTTPSVFANDVSQTSTILGYTNRKVPVDWVVDGVEAYALDVTTNQKRFPAKIDAGYVHHINGQGYTIYRNVDKPATEAIEGNAAKLVYGYQLGTTNIGGSTDPSGIDAEASIKNGARIIYKDTNNSSNDFHMRSKASLRTN